MLHKGQCNMWLIASKILQDSGYLIDPSIVCLNNQKHCKLKTHQCHFYSTLNDRRQTAENSCDSLHILHVDNFCIFQFCYFCVNMQGETLDSNLFYHELYTTYRQKLSNCKSKKASFFTIL